eukprot:PhM_4_TR14010/c0_g1_i1/m.64200
MSRNSNNKNNMSCSFLFMSMFLLLITVSEAADSTGVTATPEVTSSGQMVCICRCCYLGDCVPVANSTFLVSSCDECKTQRCLGAMHLESARRKTAAILEEVDSDIGEQNAPDVCVVISLLERATCGDDVSQCKVTTSFQAFCVNRNWGFGRYSNFAFMLSIGVFVVYGLFKDHIPALHSFNLRHFNY